MEFIKNMYIYDKEINKNDIIEKLFKKQSISNIYCICIDKNSNSVMEIIHSHEIHKQVYSNKNYIVIGLANNKNNAKKLVCNIIQEFYNKYNNLTNLKEIILQSLFEKGENT